MLAAGAFTTPPGGGDAPDDLPAEAEQPSAQRPKQGAWQRMEQLAQQRAAEGGDTFDLWPEHVAALQLWRNAAQSQLRWDQGRPTGIAWESLRAHPATHAIPEADRERVLLDVSVMEPAWVGETARRMSESMRRKHG